MESKIILNVRIDVLNLDQILDLIYNWIKTKGSKYICCIPIHTIINAQDCKEVEIALNASNLNTADGMGVVLLLKLYGIKNASRVYGPDLMDKMCMEYPNLRYYFLGGTQNSLEKLVTTFQRKNKNINIVGYSSSKVSLDNLEISEDLLIKIQSSHPDIIWVGLGSPKQELWMHENINKFEKVTMIGVGAAFDFLSGNKPQAPKWIQKSGLEWLFRLLSEPKRLWKRYLIGYPRFFILLLMEFLFKIRKRHAA